MRRGGERTSDRMCSRRCGFSPSAEYLEWETAKFAGTPWHSIRSTQYVAPHVRT
jgi:hypothetical protein